MPVFERKAVTESKWMWRKCSVVRKAAGRYCKLPTSLLAIDFWCPSSATKLPLDPRAQTFVPLMSSDGVSDDIEDEKLRVLMAKVAKGGSLSSPQGYLDGYLDKYQPQPGWRATPPSTNGVSGKGQPVFELYFEGRQ